MKRGKCPQYKLVVFFYNVSTLFGLFNAAQYKSRKRFKHDLRKKLYPWMCSALKSWFWIVHNEGISRRKDIILLKLSASNINKSNAVLKGAITQINMQSSKCPYKWMCVVVSGLGVSWTIWRFMQTTPIYHHILQTIAISFAAWSENQSRE